MMAGLCPEVTLCGNEIARPGGIKKLTPLLFHSKVCTKAQFRAYGSALNLPAALAWNIGEEAI
jgi:hypothetical protein